MTVANFIHDNNLQGRVHAACRELGAATDIMARVWQVPIRKSRAVRRLGSYVARAGNPIEIRLQFALEKEVLVETFLHELAHCFDHLTHQAGRNYRKAHSEGWRTWAAALGIEPERCGESRVLTELAESRLRVIAVCRRCGFELRRLRRLPLRRRYLHKECGGELRPL